MRKSDVYRKYIFDEMSRNKDCSILEIEHFVTSLNYDQAIQLCKYFSSSRRNCVYNFISKGPDNWKTSNVDISNIYVGNINNKVNCYLERNNWLLGNIIEDNEMWQIDEFKSKGPIDMKILNFIAKKNDYDYTIVDGMHRIIRSSLDGKRQFKLTYY